MEAQKLVCYDCKHPISILNGSGALLPATDLPEPLPEATISETALKADRILSLAMDSEALSHCLCENCLTMLVSALDKNISQAEGELKQYGDILSDLQRQVTGEQSADPTEMEALTLEETLRQLKLEESAHKAELFALQKELHDSLSRESKFWQRENELELKVMNFEEDHAEVIQRIKVAEEELTLLKRTSVLNDLFYIDSYDQFGTINGLRLGRLETDVVPWEEINAAWGQCVLLLSSLAKRIGFQSAKYILYPMGSFSRIAEIHDHANKFELFGSDTNFSKLYSRFNSAQGFFLDYLQEFAVWAETQYPGQLFLPYRIDTGTIGELPLKFDINAKDNWTRALRYMLQTLKSLLLLIVKVSD